MYLNIHLCILYIYIKIYGALALLEVDSVGYCGLTCMWPLSDHLMRFFSGGSMRRTVRAAILCTIFAPYDSYDMRYFGISDVTYCHIWTTFAASTILNRDHNDPMPGFVDLLPRCVDRTPGDPCDSCVDCCVDCQYALAFSRFEQFSSLA
jgi:hypothetical protein